MFAWSASRSLGLIPTTKDQLGTAMDWSSLFASIYLLGVLFTAAVTAKPIRRIMGWDRPGDHADPEDASDARMIVAFAVCGVAAIWPLTLPMYVASRVIPASAGSDDDDHGVALVLAGPE